ncbi:hypothetical protein BH23ACT4_BH23ACT4_16360 [soil metagenome]
MIAVGTRWVLFSHYWVVISLLLRLLAVAVLLVETRTIRSLAETATEPATTPEELAALARWFTPSVVCCYY